MNIYLTQLRQLMDVEFTSFLTDITKLVLYYLGGGVLWLYESLSNHQTDARDRAVYNNAFVSNLRSYERCQNNH